MTGRKLLTAVLTEKQLKNLRAKPFIERNKIIQEGLDKHQKVRVAKIKMKRSKDFVF